MSPEAAESARLGRLRRRLFRETWVDPFALYFALMAIALLVIRCLKH